jgi:two-component system NtrC family sensor kinase
MSPSIDSVDWREANRWEVSLTARNDNRGGAPPGQGRTHDRRARFDGEEPLVLIVEDDRAIREPLCVLLRGEGYRVSLAENGQEALRKLRTEPSPDIIVLDLRMPVMDGWEFRAIQQQDPVLGLIPVVAISADGSAQAVTMSADAYLRKPLDPSDLLQTIDGILREQEWQAMSSRLEEAEHLASLGRVAAAVGHEINNPLAFVVLNLDQTLAQLRELGTAPADTIAAEVVRAPAMPSTLDGLATRLIEVTSMLETCQTGLERIRRTVGNLQRLSRSEDEVRGAVDVSKVLDQAIAMAWNQIRHRARFVTNVEVVPPVEGNTGALEQVFLNLLVNAVQAIPEGQAEQNEIRITTQVRGTEVMVEIRDTGAGIAPDLQARVFEPFFTTKPAGIGTGLGLFISRQTITDHGGRVEIESEVNKGTAFRVFLPATVKAAEPAPPAAPNVVASPAARGRVLVIDDEPAIGAAIRAALREEHDVVVAHRAIDALGRLREGESFDLLLCDLVMPDIGGPEVYAAIAERWPKLIARMVFMTGGAFTEATGDFIEKVRPHVFPKPFRLDELRALVRRRLIMLRS